MNCVAIFFLTSATISAVITFFTVLQGGWSAAIGLSIGLVVTLVLAAVGAILLLIQVSKED